MSKQEKKQFYIGDSVKISTRGYYYDSYKEAAEKMGLTGWEPWQEYKVGDEGVVVAICKHGHSDVELYGVLRKDGQQLIFSGEALSHTTEKYTLTLTEEEKDVLICVLGSTGGMPDSSPRKYIDSIYKRLYQWITEENEYPKYYNLLKEGENSLWFNDFPTPVEKSTMNLKVELDTTDVKKDIEELKVLFEQIEVIKNRIFKGE